MLSSFQSESRQEQDFFSICHHVQPISGALFSFYQLVIEDPSLGQKQAVVEAT
jgi:hypothetical protein